MLNYVAEKCLKWEVGLSTGASARFSGRLVGVEVKKYYIIRREMCVIWLKG